MEKNIKFPEEKGIIRYKLAAISLQLVAKCPSKLSKFLISIISVVYNYAMKKKTRDI